MIQTPPQLYQPLGQPATTPGPLPSSVFVNGAATPAQIAAAGYQAAPLGPQYDDAFQSLAWNAGLPGWLVLAIPPYPDPSAYLLAQALLASSAAADQAAGTAALAQWQSQYLQAARARGLATALSNPSNCVLTTWQTAGTPDVVVTYPTLTWVTQEAQGGTAAYSLVQVQGDPVTLAALAANYRYPAVQNPSLFASRQSGLLAALDAWLAAKLAGGFTVSGVVLDASATGRNWLTFQAAELLAKLQGGSITGASIVTVYDTNDGPHTLTVTAALAAFGSYGTQYDTLLATYRGKRSAMRAAATAAALDAIVLPA